MIKKHKKKIHTLIIFVLVILMLHTNILSNFVWTLPELFSDFKMPINWLECHSLGVNLITTESIDCGTGKNISQFNYGYAFLSIPYNQILDIFYRQYLPYIVIFLFIYLTTKIINPNNKLEVILLYLALLNPSSMLLIERLQLDCFIYIAAIITVYNRFYFINWFLIIYLALIKIYPIAILINIFVENKKRNFKKIFLLIIFLTTITIIYLSINKEFYLYTINNMMPGKAGYHFLYSLNSLPKIFEYFFGIKYQILLIIFYSSFIFLTIKFYKKIVSDTNYLDKELYTKTSKLFLIGGFLNLFLFTLASNFFYKEIFLILLIPYILCIKNKYNNKIFKILIYIFIARYGYLFLYAFININDGITFNDSQRIFSNKFLIVITLKSLLDFILVSIITSILYLKTKLYILDKLKN